MPKQIASNITLYKFSSIQSEIPSSDFTKLPTVVVIPFGYAIGAATDQQPEYKKLFGSISKNPLFLDSLFSIEDIRLTDDEFTRLEGTLPKGFEYTTLTKEEFGRQYDGLIAKFKETKMTEEDLLKHQKKVTDLGKSRRKYYLSQRDMVYILQLTDQGWVNYNEPYGVSNVTENTLNKLKKNGLIEYLGFKKAGPYYVKLTQRGSLIKEKLQKEIKKGKQKTDKTHTTEKS